MSIKTAGATEGRTRLILAAIGIAINFSVTGCGCIRNLKACCHQQLPVAIPAPPRTITVAGITQQPGTYELPDIGGLTLQKAIAQAGGFMPQSVAYNPVGQGALPPLEFHQRHISNLCVLIQRDEISYVIPCALVNMTELGNIRLRDRDVVTVVTYQEAGFDGSNDSSVKQAAQDFQANNPLKTVRFLGATKLDGAEISLAQVQNLLSPVDAADAGAPGPPPVPASGEPISGSRGGLFGGSTSSFIDWNRNPQIARVTRRASNDGRPRVFYIPLEGQFGMTTTPTASADPLNFTQKIHQGFVLRGGDDIAYLQINQDPLVALSQVAEQHAAAVLRQLR